MVGTPHHEIRINFFNVFSYKAKLRDASLSEGLKRFNLERRASVRFRRVMPCTFSHPLAVVPLRRLCPERLNFSALIIGSMSPDFGYYISQFRVANFAHTGLGTLAVCLPTGLLALGLFYLIRRPLCFVLPQPHRAALMPLVLRRPSFSVRSFFVAALSILLGAWTHTVWDSFTHPDGWAVTHLAILHVAVIYVGTTPLRVFNCLQQVSTFGAGGLLVVLYFRWLRCQQTTATGDTSVHEGWRYALIALLAAVALAIAVPAAFRLASSFEGYVAFRVFLFRTAVYSVAVFVPPLIVSSFVFYVVDRRSG